MDHWWYEFSVLRLICKLWFCWEFSFLRILSKKSFNLKNWGYFWSEVIWQVSANLFPIFGYLTFNIIKINYSRHCLEGVVFCLYNKNNVATKNLQLQVSLSCINFYLNQSTFTTQQATAKFNAKFQCSVCNSVPKSYFCHSQLKKKKSNSYSVRPSSFMFHHPGLDLLQQTKHSPTTKGCQLKPDHWNTSGKHKKKQWFQLTPTVS